MQTNGMGGAERVYRDTWHCIQTIYAREGFRGYYLGLTANMIRCLPAASLQFASYEFFKKTFTGSEF